jgi:hypothetical protein
MVGFCEYDNECVDSIQAKNFFTNSVTSQGQRVHVDYN